MDGLLAKTTMDQIARAVSLRVRADAYKEIWGGCGIPAIEEDILMAEKCAVEARERATKYMSVCFPAPQKEESPAKKSTKDELLECYDETHHEDHS